MKTQSFFCCCVPECSFYPEYNSSLTVRTLTCNRLSHCLFDFDCPDFKIYEQEKYNYQEFNFLNLMHNKKMPSYETSHDIAMTRNGIKIICRPFTPEHHLKQDPTKP